MSGGKGKDARQPGYVVEGFGIADLQKRYPGSQDDAIAAYLNAKAADGLSLVAAIGDSHIRFVFVASQ